ncbi:beta-ketoacyl-[acyl-carrier-protein] synthase family protein [Scleromatobacter humisilvae]|uniref:Nodulation protein E n=1 Tax=Scleromatobacter humisilvae TaxID=2897159 RepID=A0A9X1YPU7_9BURK|nr:beta-ketoacyl-[acyl-carrier-protein] synthase family protein [Scleromatobacter humisilvae]MCK9685626.1 beta-ketoacyl-[acyl-carrier-protein] synthase family protein [Scleromatobacter humisilvae]
MAATRIGIAGIGVTCPLGDSLQDAWQRLLAGQGAVGRMSFDGLPDIAAAQVTSDVSTVLSRLQQVGTERVSQMALGAVRKALAEAGIDAWSDPERVGLYLGTGMGGAATLDAGFAALYGGGRIPPLTVPAGMVNGAAAVVAIHADIRGPVLTYAVACASSSVAIAEAAHALRRGEIDIAICGGVEAPLARGTVAAWQALRTLAPPDADDPTRSCRPFSADRSGLVLGEGAAFFVLRREDDLATPPRAWLAGSAVRCDALHLTNPQKRGQVATLRAALAASGLAPADVGYCNAHGTATAAGDPVECEALREVWGEHAPALRVSSTKAAHGHLLGAGGALEAALTVMALQSRVVPATLGVTSIDARCAGLAHVLGEGQRAPGLAHAISNSFAFGGTNVALVFSRA